MKQAKDVNQAVLDAVLKMPQCAQVKAAFGRSLEEENRGLQVNGDAIEEFMLRCIVSSPADLVAILAVADNHRQVAAGCAMGLSNIESRLRSVVLWLTQYTLNSEMPREVVADLSALVSVVSDCTAWAGSMATTMREMSKIDAPEQAEGH